MLAEMGRRSVCYTQSGLVEDVTSAAARCDYSFLPLSLLLHVNNLFGCF